MLSPEFLTVTYLGASILFILSLGGLSTQETARRGNMLGILGMSLAIMATALSGHVHAFGVLIGALVVGGAIGAVLAKRVAMTSMPELVAILHSFVGLAAALVGIGSFLELEPSLKGSASLGGLGAVIPAVIPGGTGSPAGP